MVIAAETGTGSVVLALGCRTFSGSGSGSLGLVCGLWALGLDFGLGMLGSK